MAFNYELSINALWPSIEKYLTELEKSKETIIELNKIIDHKRDRKTYWKEEYQTKEDECEDLEYKQTEYEELIYELEQKNTHLRNKLEDTRKYKKNVNKNALFFTPFILFSDLFFFSGGEWRFDAKSFADFVRSLAIHHVCDHFTGEFQQWFDIQIVCRQNQLKQCFGFNFAKLGIPRTYFFVFFRDGIVFVVNAIFDNHGQNLTTDVGQRHGVLDTGVVNEIFHGSKSVGDLYSDLKALSVVRL